jgi:hypothetical protein
MPWRRARGNAVRENFKTKPELSGENCDFRAPEWSVHMAREHRSAEKRNLQPTNPEFVLKFWVGGCAVTRALLVGAASFRT